MKEKRWLGTQKYELHCFYCGGFHITGNCPQIVKEMNGWKYDRSCPETGHIKIVPNGDELYWIKLPICEEEEKA